MPRKPKVNSSELPTIPTELLSQFGDGPMTAEAINAASLAFKKALIERALGGELKHHLGYAAGASKPAEVTNQRNGRGADSFDRGRPLAYRGSSRPRRQFLVHIDPQTRTAFHRL